MNETRFQYIRNRSRQDGNNTIPTIQVQESFISGGFPRLLPLLRLRTLLPRRLKLEEIDRPMHRRRRSDIR